jgi:hypothetical protein
VVDNKHNCCGYSHHKSNDLNALGAIAAKENLGVDTYRFGG